ncbi:MAG: hypothetical protein U1F66_10780 [bacterium]
MRRSLLVFSAALALTLPAALRAEDKKAEAPKTVSSVQYNTLSGKVLEIDQAKQSMVVEGEGGTRYEITVDGTKAKNFKNIKKGDLVVVQQEESLALSLAKGAKGEKPSADVVTEKATAPVGSKPGAESVKTSSISAEVVKVDAAKSMVELKGPAGNTLVLKVKDPKNLEGVKKGDMVTATYTVATAVSVEPAPKK